MYVCLFHEKYNNLSYKNFRYRLLKGGFILSYQFSASSSSSSSSSSAPTSSGSAISSAGSSSVKSSNVSGASTVATVVSSSSIIVYSSDFFKSEILMASPISNSETSIVICSGIWFGFARTSSSYNGCCSTPPSFVPTGSPTRRS